MLAGPTQEQVLLLGGLTNVYSVDFELDSSQYAYASAAAALKMTGAGTYEFWLKTETTGTNEGLVGQWDSGDETEQCYLLYLNTSGELNAIIRAGAGKTEAVKWSLTNSAVWTHIAVTNDGSSDAGSGRFNMWENSVDKGAGTVVTSSGTSVGQVDSSDDFRVGAWANTSVTFFLDGRMDQLRIWNGTERSGAQIAANYQTTLPGGTADLDGQWRFENNFTDDAGNNDLTGSGAPTFPADPAF